MTVDRLPSGNYRARMMFNGKTHSKTYDHKPTQRELKEDFDGFTALKNDNKGTFEFYANKYIESKENVLSPSSVRCYGFLLKALTEKFKCKQLDDIKTADIQSELNLYAADHEPRTVRNLSGFISSIMGMFRPDFAYHVTLPQKLAKELYIPTADEVKKVLAYAKGKSYEVPFYLGAYGLRRSEICALKIDDLEGRTLHIHAAKVQNKDNEYVEKTTKTYSSTRDIVISQELADKIRAQGYIYDKQPYQILRALHRCQEALGIPRFRLHDLRHFYITELFEANVPEADIMYLVGHSSDYTTKRIYRHNRIAEDKKKKEALADYVQGLIG